MSSLLSFLLISSILSVINAYHLSLSILEWKNASRFCQSYCNSSLISIHNQSQYEAVLRVIGNNRYVYKSVWIGLNDIRQSDEWVWSDGTDLDFGANLDGTYPWRSNEPDQNSIDDCAAIEATKSNLFIDKEQTSNFHFLCGSCSHKLNKYIAINGFATYNDANKQCQQRFGTSLASIHNERDMREAITVCQSVTDIAGCWIGLNDKNSIGGEFKWDDETPFTFGTIFNTYPWYSTQPALSTNQHCIQMDPYRSNALANEAYLWDDANCNATARTLCNAPSEICQHSQFFISNEENTANQWIWTTQNGCMVMNNVMTTHSAAIIGNKQYVNIDGVLSVDMMYTMTNIGINGNAGIAFYLDENNCDNYYVVAIWGEYSYIFLGKFVNGIWHLMKYTSIGITYQTSTYYSIQIELLNGIEWSVRFNDRFMFKVTDINDTFHNVGNKLSGYIGIRNSNTSIIVKSLFISGDPQYNENNNNNPLYLKCNNISTANPTINPSMSPTMKPTRLMTSTSSTTNVSYNIEADMNDDIVNDSPHITSAHDILNISIDQWFWIIVIPAACLLICVCLSCTINKYCCHKTYHRRQIAIHQLSEGQQSQNEQQAIV